MTSEAAEIKPKRINRARLERCGNEQVNRTLTVAASAVTAYGSEITT